MKKRVFSLIVSVCILALITATAFAQLPVEHIRVNIPFDFMVMGRTLPAGYYEITRLSDGPEVLVISNVTHRRDHATMETTPEQGPVSSHGKLVFHRYGDSYFLHEIWTAGLNTGRELPPSHQEKILKRETLARAEAAAPETVAIAIY